MANVADEIPVSYQGRFRPLLLSTEEFWSKHFNEIDGPELRCLPGAHRSDEWLSLKALEQPFNMTAYPDETFLQLQQLYINLKKSITADNISAFNNALADAYAPLAGTPFLEAHGKTLFYPSILQLKAEALYTQTPMIGMSLGLYTAAILLLLMRLRKSGKALLTLAFLAHTMILGLRCYILQRPPVSNMFETVIYVPWIAMGVGYFLSKRSKSDLPLTGAALLSLGLLLLLKASGLNGGLENVQAVLDSQFWLTVHVLMVVGSYALFALGTFIGHTFLICTLFKPNDKERLRRYGALILQTFYFGVALLIPGTILGGIWAAQSWGRFWDWDPKESWAFISSCVYLMGIHAHRFGHIGDFGLAVGSVIGFQSITFTWYGVNYILGSGLHSYGFGQGGEIYYYLFLFLETIFIMTAILLKKRLHETH